MISPDQAKELGYNDRKIQDIVHDVDDSINSFHGWYPWEEALLNYELPLSMRNRIANMYIKSGWKYVYHHTSSENRERPGLTLFKFSMEPLEAKCCRGMHKLAAAD